MKKTIPFLKYRYIAFAVSIALFVIFIVGTVFNKGLNMGVDFVGGVKVIATFPKGVNESKIRNALEGMNPVVQSIGADEKNEYMISTKLSDEKKTKVKKSIKRKSTDKTDSKSELKTSQIKDEHKKNEKKQSITETNIPGNMNKQKVAGNNTKIDDKTKSGNKEEKTKKEDRKEQLKSDKLKQLLVKAFTTVTFLSTENVGPAIGDYLKKSAVKLFLIAIILMMFYLAFRFEIKYSVGAMAALLHDIVLTIAFCGFAGVEINIPIIAALLTIFGYSINDSIVIFDRIRENVQIKSKQTFFDVINKSITLSISRTLLTSLTTLFAVLSLYLMGGESLSDFAMVLLFGIFVGTYSSVYIASPVLVGWEKIVAKINLLF